MLLTTIVAGLLTAAAWQGELPAQECAVDKEPLRVRVQRSEQCRGLGNACCTRTQRVSLWHPRGSTAVLSFEHGLQGSKDQAVPPGVEVGCQPGRIDIGYAQEKPISFAYRGPGQPLELHESVSARLSALQNAKPSAEGRKDAQDLVHGLRLVNSLDASSKSAGRGVKVGGAVLAEAMLVLALQLSGAGDYDAALEQLADLEEAALPEGTSAQKRGKSLTADIQKRKQDAFPLRISDRLKVGMVPLEVEGPPEPSPDLFFHQNALCLTPSVSGGELRCFDVAKKAWSNRPDIETPQLANIERGDCSLPGCQTGICFKLPPSSDAPSRPREVAYDHALALYKGGALVLGDGKVSALGDGPPKDVSGADVASFVKQTPGSRLLANGEFFIDDAGRVGRVSQPSTVWEVPGDAKSSKSPLNSQFPTWKVLFASPDMSWAVVARRDLEAAKTRVTEQELWLFKMEPGKSK
jgi:hypothetical protein